MEEKKNTDLAIKLVLFSALAIITALLLYQLKALIICIILAITLASAMSPIAETLERKKIPRVWTVLGIYIIIALLYGLLAASVIPSIKEQGATLFEKLPGYIAKVNEWYHKALNLSGGNADAITVSAADLRSMSINGLKKTLDMSAGLLGLLANGILILFLSAYFVVEADQIWASVLRWMPMKMRNRFAPMIVPLGMRMGGYVRGQLLVALLVAAFLFLGFALIGVDYALLLALIAGTLNLVPYVGSMIAVASAIVVAFNQQLWMVPAVLGLYALEQWVESSFMVPILLGKHVELHPLIVLLVIIVGAVLGGIPGALVSVPLASALMYLAEEFYLKPSLVSGSTDEAQVP